MPKTKPKPKPSTSPPAPPPARPVAPPATPTPPQQMEFRCPMGPSSEGGFQTVRAAKDHQVIHRVYAKACQNPKCLLKFSTMAAYDEHKKRSCLPKPVPKRNN